MVATKSRILAMLAVVGLAAACEQAGPTVPADDTPAPAAAVTLPTEAAPHEFWVCKDAPAGSFSFSVTLSQGDGTGETVHEPNPTIAADACVKVASGGGASISVVESDPSPYLFEKIEVYEIPLTDPTGRILIATDVTNDGTPVRYGDRGMILVFYNVSPPSTGCTLTQGYWKTHSEYGPAPYDDTWALLANGADTPFFLSGMSWHDLFWTSISGNAYYSLAHQYMAARLNELAGASTAAVAGVLAEAQALFETWTPADIDPLKGNDALVKQFKDLASTLDDYNNGLIGPGHCGDVPTDI